MKNYEYPESLKGWYVISENPANTEFAVGCYVKGEDYDYVDGYFDNRAEAELRRDWLEAADMVFTYGVYPVMTREEWLEKGETPESIALNPYGINPDWEK